MRHERDITAAPPAPDPAPQGGGEKGGRDEVMP